MDNSTLLHALKCALTTCSSGVQQTASSLSPLLCLDAPKVTEVQSEFLPLALDARQEFDRYDRR